MFGSVARGAGRLLRPLRGGWRSAGAGVRSAAGGVSRGWRRSLQLRVISTTMVVSVLVVAVLGIFLMNQIASGLLASERTTALDQTHSGLLIAQTALQGPGGGSFPALNTLVATLQARSGPGDSFYVVVAQNGTGSYLAGVEGGQALVRSIPRGLRTDVRQEQSRGRRDQLWYVPTSLSVGGQNVPALAVGVPVSASDQLYYLFPLTDQVQVLRLVETTLLGTGTGLVVLLALIVSLVTRWVVVPIRQAARAASRLSGGNLGERMSARGTTDLAALARAFNEMAASLQDKLAKLEELSSVQRQFVSDVSHELRTPLTTIRCAADVLFEARGQLDPAAMRSAELLQGQIERFEALLADLLEISRHDANVATLDAESTDMCDLVLRAAADAEQLAARRGTRIDFRLPPHPCVAEMDRRRVERVLRNLLDNAVEHGEGREVVVTVAADRDAVAVAVRDYGCGLRPEEHQLVFDRFWRADPARARTTGGTGLGLAIALEDTKLHGGWLQAWGEVGKGSVFRLTLPRVVGGELVGSPLPLGPAGGELAAAVHDVPAGDAAGVLAEGPGVLADPRPAREGRRDG